jgi:2,3-dimethylmalate lyase
MTDPRRQKLRSRLADKELLVAPGVFDGISARIADQMGFEALYMTGYGAVASHLALPYAGIATYSDIQEFPKKCGHMTGRRVVPVADMVDKIKVAVASRDDGNFLIIARTDARTTLGLDEALRRADAYAKAGADILFVESPESVEEMRIIGRSFDRPLIANMVEGGRTPVVDRKTLEEIGYRVAIFPVLGLLAAGQALRQAYRHLRDSGSSIGGDVPLYNFAAFSDLMGFDAVAAFDETWRR